MLFIRLFPSYRLWIPEYYYKSFTAKENVYISHHLVKYFFIFPSFLPRIKEGVKFLPNNTSKLDLLDFAQPMYIMKIYQHIYIIALRVLTKFHIHVDVHKCTCKDSKQFLFSKTNAYNIVIIWNIRIQHLVFTFLWFA